MKYGDLKECKNCHSNNIQVVKYIITNGRIQYRHQCKACGYLDIANIKYASIPKDVDIPLVNEKLRECYYENNSVKYENYKDIDYDKYIVSDKWYQKRPEIFELKGEKCAICGKDHSLDIHHLSYDTLGHEEINNYADVVPLCRHCHEKIHNFLEVNEYKFKTLEADLLSLRNYYFLHYHEAINETVYKYTKDLRWHNDIAIKVFLDTLYGKYHCKNDIQPHFDSVKVLKKIKSED